MDVDLLLEVILRLLGVLKPSQLDQIKQKVKALEEQYEKDREDALVALQSGDIAALNRIIAKLLELQES